MFDPNAEAIFAKAFGRTPQTPEERSFLQGVASRKSGSALQGALQFQREHGGAPGSLTTASTNPNPPSDSPPALPTPNSAPDAILNGVSAVRQQYALVQQMQQQLAQQQLKLFTRDLQSQAYTELLKNPEFQKLQALKSNLDAGTQNATTGIDIKSGITDPAQAAAASANERADLARTASSLADQLENRRQFVQQQIGDIAALTQQRVDVAKTGLDAASAGLNAAISVAGEERAQELLPGQKTAQELANKKTYQEVTGTAPLTPEQILNIGKGVSEGYISDPQALMDFLQNRQQTTGLNAPQRNNNPLNLKVGGLSQKWIDRGQASVGSAGTDGGNFLKFDSPETGFAAAEDALFNSSLYGNKTLEQAMRTWSGNGYGAEVAPGLPKDVPLKNFTVQQQQQLVMNMAKREGYGQGAPKSLWDQIFAKPQDTGTLSPEKQKALNTLTDNVRQDLDIQNFRTVSNSYQTIESAAARGDGVGDLTLLRLYAKLTDPTTGVREEEYKSMQTAQGALAAKGIQLTKGQINGQQLTAAAREQFKNAALELYNQRKANYDDAVGRITQQAKAYGVDPNLVIPNLAAGGTSGKSNAAVDDVKSKYNVSY